MNVAYWDNRYQGELQSGQGSRGPLLAWKADTIGQVLRDHDIATTLDIGSGDGRVAKALDAPGYLGVDPSANAVAVARKRAPRQSFEVLDNPGLRDAHLSVDVIFHLIDHREYADHLRLLFTARKLVVVHSSNHDEHTAPHVRHRRWTDDIPAEWVKAGEADHDMSLATLTWWVRR